METSYKGMDYLRRKLKQKQKRVKVRYDYYEMKNIVRDFNISTPPDLRYWMGSLGWCARAVDSLADRLVFREFRNDIYNMNDIFLQNNKDILIDSAMLSALISSCSFIYITADENGYPLLKVIDGYHATGVIDPTTNMLKEGYAVLEWDHNNKPITEAYLIPGATYIFKYGRLEGMVGNEAPYPLLVPMINRPDAARPFGHSRISRACMSIVGSAVRTAKRSEIASEFYSYPQKYILGMDEDAERMDTWRATMSSLLRIDKDADGGRPTVGQFSQQSMAPHTEQLRMFAGLFAGETGLTLDDLGFPSANPSSAEAIKSSHETLRLTARKAQRDFGTALLNTGYLAACVRDKFGYKRSQVANVKATWMPIFEPDSSMLSVIGDGAIKINQAVEGYFNKETLRDLTGIDAAEETTTATTATDGDFILEV
jgi:hypothetical protein